ncbi:MAG: Minf_1886 family protein [Verrucomicrobiota bacterium]
MQQSTFEEAVRSVSQSDPRYAEEAYLFLRDALDFTLREVKGGEVAEDRHVSGPELLEGFRRYALDEFGPLARTVLEDWGLTECAQVGDLVFNLIEIGAFGKTQSDKREDFRGDYTFEAAFTAPFLPAAASRKDPDARPGRQPEHPVEGGEG